MNPAAVAVQDSTYQYLKYGAIATTTIASGVLMTSSLGTFLVIGTTVGASYLAISHTIDLLSDDPANITAAKAEQAFKIALWTALIVGAVALGLGGATIFCGASTLLSGVQAGSALELLLGLRNITFALGFVVPFGKSLLVNLHSLDEQISQGIQEISTRIGAFQNMDGLTIVRLLIGYFTGAQGDNIDITMLQFLPDDEIQEYFRQNAPLFTNERLKQLVDHYPNVLTYEFLCSCLSQDQINDIIIPPLDQAIERLGQLSGIKNDLTSWPNTMNDLESRNNGSDQASLYSEVTPLVQQIAGHINLVSGLSLLLKRLPQGDVSNSTVQEKITQLKGAQDQLGNLLPDLNALRARMVFLSNATAPKDQEDDLDEEAYMVLGALGWRLVEFKQFAPRLGLPSDNNAMATVSQALAERGLATRGDLIRHGILNREPGEDLSRELLIERLGAFVSNPPPAAPVNNQVPPAAPVDDWADTLHTVALFASHAFHYISAAALIGVQVYYQPVPTAVGIVVGLVNNDAVESMQLAHIWQASPDYVGQSLEERCRELWWRIIWTRGSIGSGSIGGVWSGLQHADAIRFYARHWINRLF